MVGVSGSPKVKTSFAGRVAVVESRALNVLYFFVFDVCVCVFSHAC